MSGLFTKVKTSYVEIPLSLVYPFLNKEKYIGELYLGGYGALKIHAVKKTAAHKSSIEKANIENVRRLESGIHIGFNFKRKISENFFLIDFRSFYGLSNVFEIPENQVRMYQEVQKVSHAGFILSLGYEF